MKAKINKSVILLSLCVSSMFSLLAQCPPDALVKKCSSKLGEYMFLKSFKIEKSSEEVEYSYVFTNNTTYLISLGNISGSDANIEINLYDSSRKLVLSNKLKVLSTIVL